MLHALSGCFGANDIHKSLSNSINIVLNKLRVDDQRKGFIGYTSMNATCNISINVECTQVGVFKRFNSDDLATL